MRDGAVPRNHSRQRTILHGDYSCMSGHRSVPIRLPRGCLRFPASKSSLMVEVERLKSLPTFVANVVGRRIDSCRSWWVNLLGGAIDDE